MDKIILRALTTEDISRTLSWHNDPEISFYYSNHPFPVNKEMEQQWYEKILRSNFPTTVFGIEHVETNELIGISLLKDINLINRVAEFAIYIGEKKYRGKGLSKEVVFLTLDFAFKKLGLNRIFLKVLDENKKAISLYRKLGFIEEGILRNSVYKKNQYRNEILMGILKDEFND